MLTETLLKIPFTSLLCDWSMFSRAHLSVAARKINLSQAASGMIFQQHKRLPVSICQRQTRRFRVFAAGYWKDFQN
jgi:hypothetical protein